MFFTTNNKHTTYLTNTHSRCLLMILNRYLSNNQLNGTIPSSIGTLEYLEYLYVNPMRFTEIH